MTVADYVAFFAMGVVFCGLIYLVIWLGDLPAKVARERNHPQVAAVQAMAWLGLLFTGGVVYILALVWAYYDYSNSSAVTNPTNAEIEALRKQVADLQAQLATQGGKS